MPSRYIREGLLTSDAFNALDDACEAFWTRLLLVVDDFGRFDGRAIVVRSRCYPLREDVTVADVERRLDALHRAGLVVRYVVEGKPYLQLTKWTTAPRAKSSKYPEPLANNALPAPAYDIPKTPARGVNADADQSNADAPDLRSSIFDLRSSDLSSGLSPDIRPPAYAELNPATDEIKPGEPMLFASIAYTDGREAKPEKPKKTPKSRVSTGITADADAYLARFRELTGSDEAAAPDGRPFRTRYALARQTGNRDAATMLRALEAGLAGSWWGDRTLMGMLSERAIQAGLAPKAPANAAPARPSQFAPPPALPRVPLYVHTPLPQKTPESEAERLKHRPKFAQERPPLPTPEEVERRAAEKRARYGIAQPDAPAASGAPVAGDEVTP
jgi:hypothetical protein